MEKVVDKPKESTEEQVSKFILMGMTEESAKISKYIKSQKDYTLISLNRDEMDLIVSLRKKEQEEVVAEEFIQSDEVKNRARNMVVDLIKMFPDMSNGIYISMSSIKRKTKMPWRQLRQTIATLDMYGFIQFLPEDKNYILGIVEPDLILRNRMTSLAQNVDLIIGQALEIDINHKELIGTSMYDFANKLKALKPSI